MLTTFFVLASSRLAVRIKAVAAQGALLSALYLTVRGHLFDIHTIALFFITFIVKTIFIPILISRTAKSVQTKTEFEPVMSSPVTLMIGAALIVISFTSIRFFPLVTSHVVSTLTVPVALATVLIGFLILVTKAKATNQVIGFLILENGIFTFGMTIISDFPMMVEFGVLLDLLVGVFIMGIMIYQINKTFDHIDTRTLSVLGDE
jgi:hydrogenase-4 component E